MATVLCPVVPDPYYTEHYGAPLSWRESDTYDYAACYRDRSHGYWRLPIRVCYEERAPSKGYEYLGNDVTAYRTAVLGVWEPLPKGESRDVSHACWGAGGGPSPCPLCSAADAQLELFETGD
jgi:hypothetical protein